MLGVKRDASTSEIKKAYFQLAKKYHPGTNQDDEAAKKQFQEAAEAYEVLSDDEKRPLYDNFGHAGLDGGGGGGGNPFGQGFGGGGFHAQGQSMEDIFEQLFTGRARGPRRGQDLQYRLQLSFLEAVHGCEKKINFQYQKRGPDGRPEVVSRETGVDIPAGVDTGMTLQVPGQGADGDPGMPRGNLMVELRVAEDKYFKRDPRRSEDIHVEIPVTISQVSDHSPPSAHRARHLRRRHNRRHRRRHCHRHARRCSVPRSTSSRSTAWLSSRYPRARSPRRDS